MIVFEGEDISNKVFDGFDLRHARFDCCILTGTVFKDCNMDYAVISKCVLDSNTKFINCSFNKTRIEFVDLSGVYFSGTKLDNALFSCVKNLPSDMFPLLLRPASGEFKGYKAVDIGNDNYCIAELYIPEDAKVVNAYNSRKCRASKAKVMKFYSLDGKELDIQSAYSIFVSDDDRINYIKGEYVYPDKFVESREIECINGIHFFITFDEAVEYIRKV